MISAQLPYAETNYFSPLVIDYLQQKESLLPYLQGFPNTDNIAQQMELKLASYQHRSFLTDFLKKQYQKFPTNESVIKNIELLGESNTYTVTTAHQPNIFTGYLYTIYKAVHAINLCKRLQSYFPEKNFVPVFYLGSEDHDLEEIGNLNFASKSYSWQTQQTGACGEMNPGTLKDLINTINAALPSPILSYDATTTMMLTTYQQHDNLSEATQAILHQLLGQEGLVILDANHADCKRLFVSMMEDELLNQSSLPLVVQTLNNLSAEYKIQLQPRPINLFYKKYASFRERIILEQGVYKVLNTDIQFTQEEIISELNNHPDRFSPNVILRPLLQETLLPNIAFIGGGGELAYWMQLKAVFDHHQLPYPLLYLRNSVLFIDSKTNKIIQKNKWSWKEIFYTTSDLLNQKLNEDKSYQQLQEQIRQLDEGFLQIRKLSETISPNLLESMKAHNAKHNRIMLRVAQKFKSHLTRANTEYHDSVYFMKNSLFPNGFLQERYLNMIELQQILGTSIIPYLLQYQDPESKELLILSPSE